MAPRTITVVGSINADLVTVTSRMPDAGETLESESFAQLPGGKGANSAVAAARLSHANPHRTAAASASPPDGPEITVRQLGAVGNDAFGPTVLEALRRNLVDVSSVATVDGLPTAVSVIIIEEKHGENRILYAPGANHHLAPAAFLAPESLASPGSGTAAGALPDLLVAQLEMRKETVVQAMAAAKIAGVQTLLNPAPASPLPEAVFAGLTHLILNETEAAILTGKKMEAQSAWEEAIEWFWSKGVENVVVTLGEKGAFYGGKGRGMGLVDAAKVEKVVDTTGAGYVPPYDANICMPYPSRAYRLKRHLRGRLCR